jgi:four helix bundle protein
MQSFRRLDVWRKAHALALNVRRVTRGFSRGEFASLRSQIRSAESVPFNIVEGCDANSRKEFARYREISIKSNFELEYQLQLAYDNCALGDRS